MEGDGRMEAGRRWEVGWWDGGGKGGWGEGPPEPARYPKDAPQRASIVVFCFQKVHFECKLDCCSSYLFSMCVVVFLFTVCRVLHFMSFVFVGFVSRVAVFGQCAALM